MYSKVEKEKYQKVTGNSRSAILAGRFLASVTAQLLVSFQWMDLRELNYLTLGGNSSILYYSYIFLKSSEILGAFRELSKTIKLSNKTLF